MVSANYVFDNIDNNDPQLAYDLVISQSMDQECLFGLWSDNVLHKVGSVESSSDIESLKELNIHKVIVLNDEAPYRHIDYDVFDPNKFESYFESSNSRSTSKKSAQYEKLKEKKIYTLHYWDRTQVEHLDNMMSDVLPYHISSAMANVNRNKEDQLLCYISPNNRLHMTLKLDGEFHFYNQYECQTKQDYLYYVLLILENFNLTSANFPVVLGGEITSDSPIFELLKSYLQNVRFFENSRYTVTTSSHPYHYYLPFIIAKECA